MKRTRLSIDLNAYPDVRDMLAEAVEATGQTPTTLTMLSLRDQLPNLVNKLEETRKINTAKFLTRYPSIKKK